MFLDIVSRKKVPASFIWILAGIGWAAVLFLADKVFTVIEADSLTSIDSTGFQFALYVACTAFILAPSFLVAIAILLCDLSRSNPFHIFNGVYAGALIGMSMFMAQPYLRTASAYEAIAVHGDDFAHADIARQGNEIRFEGSIGYGASRRVATLLNENPAISRIVLDSRGGRMGPAIAIAKIIKAHDLAVHVPYRCESACTLLFIASRHRSLGPQAQLGFHSFRLPDGTNDDNAAINSFFARQWRELVASDIDASFLADAYSTPADTLWRPDRAKLAKAGLLSAEIAAQAH